MLYFVSVYYSWTSEHPLYAFATKDEAIEFMHRDYDNEYIQATNPDEYSASSEPLCPLERATHSAW